MVRSRATLLYFCLWNTRISFLLDSRLIVKRSSSTPVAVRRKPTVTVRRRRAGPGAPPALGALSCVVPLLRLVPCPAAAPVRSVTRGAPPALGALSCGRARQVRHVVDDDDRAPRRLPTAVRVTQTQQRSCVHAYLTKSLIAEHFHATQSSPTPIQTNSGRVLEHGPRTRTPLRSPSLVVTAAAPIQQN